MGKVLLVDVDSKIPNIALMRISTYHKSFGDTVDIERLKFNGYRSKKKIKKVDATGYDKVYCSNIFACNNDRFVVSNCEDVIIGGIGSKNPNLKLPKHIEHCEYDYSLYPENNKSYGFITRGCIRNCWFCFVPKTEGKLYRYSNISDIVRHDKVSFMDNNILAYDKHMDVLNELINLNIKCEFNQGLDIRLINHENSSALSKLRYIGEYIFAFDDIAYKDIIEEKLSVVRKYIKSDWKIKFFIYIHPDMDLKTMIDRAEWCRKNRCLPYVMRDQSCWDSKDNEFYIDYTAYCNQPSFFKKMTFEEFVGKRYKNKDRIQRVLEIYNDCLKRLT